MSQPLREVLRALCLGELPWPLYCHGPAGVGKTLAAYCLLDVAGGLYFTAEGLADALREADKGSLLSPAGRPVSRTELWRELESTSLVVLDEIGQGGKPAADWVYRAVKRLLDARGGRPLFAISNLPLSEIALLYDDPVASRLGCGTVLHQEGPDRRMQGG